MSTVSKMDVIQLWIVSPAPSNKKSGAPGAPPPPPPPSTLATRGLRPWPADAISLMPPARTRRRLRSYSKGKACFGPADAAASDLPRGGWLTRALFAGSHL